MLKVKYLDIQIGSNFQNLNGKVKIKDIKQGHAVI